MNTFELTLDLDKGHGPLQTVTIRQGDKNATTIVATVCDHGVQLAIAGLSARFCMSLPDNAHYYRKAAAYSEGTVTVTVDETSAASVAGITHTAYFELLQGSTVIASTASFAVVVLPSATSGKTVGETYDGEVERAIAALDVATAGIPAEVAEDVDAWLAAHPDATTTVQDNSVTDAKLIQSGGILQRERWLETMLPNIPRKVTSESDVHSVTDSAGGGPLGIEVYGRSTQNGTPTPDAPVPIVSVDGLSVVTEGTNLAHDKVHAIGSSHSSVGVTYVMEADGTITATGTATSNSWAYGNSTSKNLGLFTLLPAGTYTASCQQADGTVMTGRKLAIGGTSQTALFSNQTEPQTFTLSEPAFVLVVPVVMGGTTVDGASLWVMLNKGATALPFVAHTGWSQDVDLQGNQLRSLPDGTRDEVIVDCWGHATLVQRVGAATIDGVNVAANNYTRPQSPATAYRMAVPLPDGAPITASMRPYFLSDNFHYDAEALSTNAMATGQAALYQYASRPCILCVLTSAESSVALGNEWFAAHPTTVLYPLAEPVTVDLGYIDPALLPAPDLTAYAVPSAPSVLKYGFDVAAALAEIATS